MYLPHPWLTWLREADHPVRILWDQAPNPAQAMARAQRDLLDYPLIADGTVFESIEDLLGLLRQGILIPLTIYLVNLHNSRSPIAKLTNMLEKAKKRR